jgi:hypothetical protein
MADPMKAQRRQAARRLQATLEQIKPLLHEHDLVPRDLLDRLDRHGEDWAITLDPRAAPGEPGSVVDAAPVVDGLAHLGESLDAYDYPAAEAALDLALSQLRSLHA